MGVELTTQAENEIAKGIFEPQIVVAIKGYPLLCTGTNLILDERLKGKNTPDYYAKIDLKKSQRKVNQQLALDKGGSSSTATFKAYLIDENEVFTNLFSYVTNNEELLEREARVYFGFTGGTFPRDFTPFISGTVGNIETPYGGYIISINHPDKDKKQPLFSVRASQTVGELTDTSTAITIEAPIEEELDFHNPTTGFRTFIKIDDEIIEYTSYSGNIFTGLTRGALDTIADDHEDEAEVSSFYEITGNSVDLPRKLLMSQSGDSETVEVFGINTDGVTTIQNAIFFDVQDLREDIGASTGDFIDLTSITLPGNDFTNRTIVDYGQVNNRSYYIVDGTNLTTETTPNASCITRSQFDVYPEGCGLKMWQVDQAEFERIETLFSSRFLDFRFYIKDEIDTDEWINEKIYLPSSFYHLPRGGKNSIGVFAPPLTSVDTLRVNKKTITKKSVGKISPKRGTNRHFFNFITFRIDDDSLEDKFTVRRTVFSQDSVNRIPARNKGIIIESGGLRKDSQTLQVITTNSDRIIERYRYAALEVSCTILYSEGIKTQIGDAVIFGDSFLQISDDSRGDREFRPRIMQVINRSIDFLSGQVNLTLLDTSYSIFARFGIISLASSVVSVDGNIVETTPYLASITDTEVESWTPFLGSRVTIRLPDFCYSEELELQAIVDGKLVFVNAPTLPSFPVNNGQVGALNKDYELTDLIIETTAYPQNNIIEDQELWKDTYVYFNPRLTITNVIDASNFEVSATDSLAVVDKAFIIVHSPDFTDSSQEVTVTSINSNIITTSAPLNYLPLVGDQVDLVGFVDGGYPFRWF